MVVSLIVTPPAQLGRYALATVGIFSQVLGFRPVFRKHDSYLSWINGTMSGGSVGAVRKWETLNLYSQACSLL